MPVSRILAAAGILLMMLAVSGPAAMAASPAPTAAQMQRFLDQMAIQQLLIDYGRTLDNRDFAAYSQLFAEQGEWKGTLGTLPRTGCHPRRDGKDLHGCGCRHTQGQELPCDVELRHQCAG